MVHLQARSAQPIWRGLCASTRRDESDCRVQPFVSWSPITLLNLFSQNYSTPGVSSLILTCQANAPVSPTGPPIRATTDCRKPLKRFEASAEFLTTARFKTFAIDCGRRTSCSNYKLGRRIFDPQGTHFPAKSGIPRKKPSFKATASQEQSRPTLNGPSFSKSYLELLCGAQA